jgi:hypothetical protein
MAGPGLAVKTGFSVWLTRRTLWTKEGPVLAAFLGLLSVRKAE